VFSLELRCQAFCPNRLAEVVMAVLLSSFKFEIAEKHSITWKMSGIAGPYVESLNPATPQLPVFMSLVDRP
jgi:hypothetical protein